MKLSKILVAYAFLLAFALSISAQNNQYPNELKGYEFFGNGQFGNLKLLVSTKDDIKMFFGENCENGCDYNEEWKIGFSYVNGSWYRQFTEKGNERIYKPKPKFIGRLAGISLLPKRQILLSESVAISKELECNNANTIGNNVKYNSRVCIDDKRIIYLISNETTADEKILKGQLMSIDYALSKKDDDEIFALVQK